MSCFKFREITPELTRPPPSLNSKCRSFERRCCFLKIYATVVKRNLTACSKSRNRMHRSSKRYRVLQGMVMLRRVPSTSWSSRTNSANRRTRSPPPKSRSIRYPNRTKASSFLPSLFSHSQTSQIAQLRASLSSLQAANQQESSSHAIEVAELQTQVQTLTAKLSTLTRQLDTALSEKDTLDARFTQAKSENSELQSSLQSLKSETRSLIQEHTSLQKL